MRSRLVCLLVLAVAPILLVPAGATAQAIAGPKAFLVADADRGTVLASLNEHTAMYPASTAKLMTALLVADRLPLDGTIAVSASAAGRPAMRIGMKEGERWSVADALHSMLMVSANDAAYALAEAVSGNLTQFATDANALAARLGMRDSAWNDPAGFDDDWAFDGGNRASAYDLAVAARNVLHVPALAMIASLREYRFKGPDGTPHVLHNHNKLLERYPGALGLKTGYTKRAGHTLVAAAKRDGRTLIAVVLYADDPNGAAATLLDQGFAAPASAPGTGVTLPAAKVRSAPTAHPVAIATPADARHPLAAAAPARQRPNWRDTMLGGTAACVAVLGLRRRAVRRRRVERLARRRAMLEAQRRGVLHLLDPVTAAGDVVELLPRRRAIG
jgi:D-alanyl-D-alanine carboxypeptidase (penicillin-binding protein 5/6)